MRTCLMNFSQLILAVLLLSTLVGRVDAADDGVVNILPLGDSITHGFREVSYRRDLWFKLQSAGYSVDFVGNQTEFVGNEVPSNLKDFDLDHEGHSGFRVEQLDANISGWLESYEADIVLLHAGTNDIRIGQSISSTLDELSSVIEKLRTHNPNIIILVARIIPGTSLDSLPFNLELDSWAVGEDTQASPLIVVDQHSGFDPTTDLRDSLHPNPAGEAKMADIWFSALQSVLTPGTPGSSNLPPTADAGVDLELSTFEDQLILEGIATDDGLPAGSSVGVSWSKVSGPGSVSFTNSSQASTSATFSQDGFYTLQLSVTDSEFTTVDEVSVRVGTNSSGGPMLSGISSYWRLDDNGGTQAVNSVNASQSGTLLNLDASHWGPGVYNSGLCFDGEPGQEVSIPMAGPELTSESVSLSGWVQVDDTFNRWVWVAGQGDNYGLFIRDNGSVTFYFYFGSSWTGVSMAAPSVLDGGWHHVAGTFDDASGVMAVYLDGIQLTSRSTSSSIVHAIGDGFSLGSMRGQRNFKGCLDEIQVYGRALSELEVQQLFQQ